MPPRVSQAAFHTRMWNFYQSYRRDIFFSCVAACALFFTARAELMRHGVLERRSPVELYPKVTKQFGHKKEE
ncbi:unnamed protein product [Phytomonas sp. EM1]|nr:unnamed protein product [Phytomonas sp. EM1]|eukprot:CCW64253.1 unnamed protein product [Phytomonas sp. isolate EM1]